MERLNGDERVTEATPAGMAVQLDYSTGNNATDWNISQDPQRAHAMGRATCSSRDSTFKDDLCTCTAFKYNVI
jgi:hypothetical protein